jgi:signal transduction histidine kinase
MRRGAPLVLIGLGVALLLGSYVVYTRGVVRELRRDAQRTGRMYAKVLGALNDPSEEAASAALFDLAAQIRETGIAVIVTDPAGNPTAVANLPFDSVALTDPRVKEYIAELDRINPPVVEPGIGTIHFGNPPVVRGLRIIPLLQAALLAALVAALVAVVRTHGRADRERVWSGMARESAHQLGTPLSSLSGWIALLEDQENPSLDAAVVHMRADLERLERVAHRFERIGRPPGRERLDVGALTGQVATYFRARVPTLANTVSIQTDLPAEPLMVDGDPVLLEWAIEAITKNAIDALAGRGGVLRLSATLLPEGPVRIRITDDGPGIPRELRNRIFEPGFTTKQSGWGIGLSLARRIVEEAHDGTLRLIPTERGATFDIILR